VEGVGCSLASWSLVADDVQAGLLRLKPVGKPQLTRDIKLHMSIYRPISSATEAVLRIVRETAAELIASGNWAHADLLEESIFS
jgi:DNA-binding transcriptional LysR family regulator